ncbi:MAG TPA: cation:proton antiporter [Ktedonobacterales bacterium]
MSVDLWFGLLAAVLTVAALISGLVDRAPVSFPMIFLGIGFLIGPLGLKLLPADQHSPILTGVATISLALVLFLDAARFDAEELRRDWRVPLLALGPGTLLVIAGVTLAARLLLSTTWLDSLLLGGVLASVDPIVLRDVVRHERIPRSVRRALTIEAGTNDIVVLPVVLVVIAVSEAATGGFGYWLGFLAELVVLSPLVGLVVGGVGAWLMGKADARYNIRREFQALYGLGLVLASYTAGQVVGGDGFIAAFFAGLAVALFDVTLCDCFMEYGEVTAEMVMLLAFMLFGAVISGLLGTIPVLAALALGGLEIIVIRPLAVGIVLARAQMSLAARAFMGWFGPRGLSALLLALLAVEAGMSGATRLLAIAGVVVALSVVVHGVTATPLSEWYGRRVEHARSTPAEEREGTAEGLFEPDADDLPRVSPADLHAMIAADHAPIILDVRARAQHDLATGQIPGSVRVLPDRIHEWAAHADRTRPIITYCT